MATFPAEFFTFSTKYPESGSRLQFARSYVYTIEAEAPDQRTFSLSLMGMKYFLDSQGDIDLTVHTNRNMAVLEKFYNDHRLALSFDFNHPVYGTLVCKFKTPLEIPEGIPGGDGALETFRVELIEIP